MSKTSKMLIATMLGLPAASGFDIPDLPFEEMPKHKASKMKGRALSREDMQTGGYVWARGSWWRKDKAEARGLI